MIEVKDYQIQIKDLPIPPSANALYSSFVRGSKIFKCKSKLYVEYEKKIRIYGTNHQALLMSAHKQIELWLKNPQVVLNIDQVFYQTKTDCLTLDGRIKKNDVFNLIKALHDQVGFLLFVDDRFFFSGNVVKVISDRDRVNVAISPSPLID